LLGILVIDYASVVDYASNGFYWVLIDRPGMCQWWSLVCTLGPLIAISLLLAISCKVTRFSTNEACEDFPLSVFLDGSLGVSSLSATSYALFMSVSSWEEIFCFRNSCPSSSWRCVHSVGITWCVVMPWFVDWWWAWSRFEPVCSVLHVCIELLLLYCGMPPIFVVLWFRSPHDVGVHGIG
jgi:hypothetical protein